MSTRITVETLSDDLPTRNRQLQRVNRLNQLEREEDQRAVEQAERLEAATTAAQRFAASRDGAVREGKLREETSAQRGGGVGAWLDINAVFQPYSAASSRNWITGDAIQFNVACGNGTKWATATFQPGYGGKQDASSVGGEGTVTNPAQIALIQLSNVGNYPFAGGEETTLLDPFQYDLDTSVGNAYLFFPPDFYDGLIPLYNLTVSRINEIDGFRSSQPTIATYLVYPINNQRAIITISAFIAYGRSDTSVVVATSPYVYSTLPLNSGLPYPSTTPAPYRDLYWQEIPEGQPGGPSWWRIRAYYLFVDQVNGGYFTTIAALGLPAPPTNWVVKRASARDDFAFVVSHDNVRKINVPPTLKAILQQRYPTPTPSSSTIFATFNEPAVSADLLSYYGNDGYWLYSQLASCMGAGVSRVPMAGQTPGDLPYYTSWPNQIYAPTHLFGSPGIYDYFDSGLKDYLLDIGVSGFSTFFPPNAGDRIITTSAYAPATGVPLFAPDHTAANSGYKYLYDINLTFIADNFASQANNYNFSMMWLFMKPDEREQASARFTEAANVNANPPVPVFSDKFYPSANPEFYYSYFTNTSAGVTVDHRFTQDYDEQAYAWFAADDAFRETTGYMKQDGWQRATDRLRLSPNRVLPPSLLLNDPARTVHPYIDLPLEESGQLSLVAWTGWSKDWTPQLLALGFSASDLRP